MISISSHPLVKHKINLLRADSNSHQRFRTLVDEISTMLVVEATQNFNLSEAEIETWSGTYSFPTIVDKQPTIVPILRAGLGMLNGSLTILPNAKVSVIGLKRNEETLEPEAYYQNIVNDITKRTAIVIDPMLATGGSAIAAINQLKTSGCKKVIAVFILGAPEGVDALKSAHPDVDIVLGYLDEKLNDVGYIMPGLGDAGDKIFGTTY